jgi:nitrogen fixation protein NifU and related proteins
MYNDKIMDHFQNPRNAGDMEHPDGVGTVGNPACGDVMTIYLKIDDGVITDIRFKTFGCGAAIASSSFTTELVKGLKIEEALKFTRQDVSDGLGGLPPIKMHCSNLALDALKAAIEDYNAKHH